MITRRRTVLVTGGAGFIGSRLCERLIREGYHVISLDNYFTGSKDNHVSGVEYREGHTKDIEKQVPETPDIIYHLGEYARVEQSVLEPDLVNEFNTLGTRAVIDFWCARRCKLVYAGSSTKFGDNNSTRYTSPYARTKAENSDLIRKSGDREKLPYAIAYFYNVYGPGERSGVYGTVIEHFKRIYTSGAPCAVVAPGTQKRNFTHVADIVDGLVRVGENGEGDEYGLGCGTEHAIIDVAYMFGFSDDDIVMFPARTGNRMRSALDTTKAHLLGWKAQRSLSEYICAFIKSHQRGERREKRILVFSTTIHPVSGLAEDAFIDLARKLPEVSFDVVTTQFTQDVRNEALPVDNVHVYRVGVGIRVDKFLLPVLGFIKGVMLTRKHRYLFAWSLMASYAALAGVMARRMCSIPLLVTLADQNVNDLSVCRRSMFRLLLTRVDQVYGTQGTQEQNAQHTAGCALPRNSLGEGDAFANALRFAYADTVRRKLA